MIRSVRSTSGANQPHLESSGQGPVIASVAVTHHVIRSEEENRQNPNDREHPRFWWRAAHFVFFPNGLSNVVGVAGSCPPQRSSSPCESAPLVSHFEI